MTGSKRTSTKRKENEKGQVDTEEEENTVVDGDAPQLSMELRDRRFVFLSREPSERPALFSGVGHIGYGSSDCLDHQDFTVLECILKTYLVFFFFIL